VSLASVKSRLVLPFWYRLTWVLRDKGPLNGCVFQCGHSFYRVCDLGLVQFICCTEALTQSVYPIAAWDAFMLTCASASEVTTLWHCTDTFIIITVLVSLFHLAMTVCSQSVVLATDSAEK